MIAFADHQEHLRLMRHAALRAADPATAVRRYFTREGTTLWIDDHAFDLTTGRVFLIATGKAAPAMARAATAVLGAYLTGGVIIAKRDDGSADDAYLDEDSRLRLFTAGHPVPDENGVLASRAAVQIAQQATAADLVVCLISGGTSALLTQPLVSPAEMQAVTQKLLLSGVTINEINIVRRRLDRVKGGGLAAAVAPARIATLILSDVVGNELAAIGSGPTVPNPDSPAAATAVLNRYEIPLSAAVRQVLEGPPEPHPSRPSVGPTVIIGDVLHAARAAADAAQKLGFTTRLSTYRGEARDVAQVAASLAVNASPGTCYVLGGESTVTVRGNGIGGRNLELALAAAGALTGHENIVVGTLATDGDDGRTNAAGAIVTGQTTAVAADHGLNWTDYLARNDSGTFFRRLESHQPGSLIITGPTGTNVNDLLFVVKYLSEP